MKTWRNLRLGLAFGAVLIALGWRVVDGVRAHRAFYAHRSMETVREDLALTEAERYGAAEAYVAAGREHGVTSIVHVTSPPGSTNESLTVLVTSRSIISASVILALSSSSSL